MKLFSVYFNDNMLGCLILCVIFDVNGVFNVVISVIMIVIKDSFFIVGLFGWLLYLNWKLILIIFIVVFCIVFVVCSFNGWICKLV